MVKYVIHNKIEEESSDDEDNKIRFKHNPINNNANLDAINYLALEHTKGLQ